MAKQNATPPPAHIRQHITYEPSTGLFRRLTARGGLNVGDVCGNLDPKIGYITLHFEGRNYKAHRLAFFFILGEWPSGDIDHVDGVRHNNTFDNLRVVSRTINMQNVKRPRKDSTHGYLGAMRAPSNKNPWSARIRVNGRSLYLGVYPTPDEAHQAYLKAKRELHEGNTL